MKHLFYFSTCTILLTGCLLTPKDPPNAIRPGDLIPINPVEAVVQLSDVSGAIAESRAEAIFFEGTPAGRSLSEVFPADISPARETKKEDECAVFQDDLSAAKKESVSKVVWTPVNAGKVFVGAGGSNKMLELLKDDYNVYLLKRNKQVAPGFYQVAVEGSKRDGHIVVPGFQMLAISMPEVIEGVRLNDTTPDPLKVFELKKGDIKLTWNSQSFPHDRTLFLFEMVSRRGNVRTTLQCVTVEPTTTSRLAWVIPKAYVQKLPASEQAQISVYRIQGQETGSEKFWIKFKGVRQYILAASITE